MAKRNGWGSSTDGDRHSTSGSFKASQKKGACDLIATPVALVVLGFVAAFVMWPGLMLRVAAVWALVDVVLVALWIAAHGGLRDER